MNDGEIAGILGTLDGLWHPQTKAAMHQFATTNIDLNSNWADEHSGWRCPVCSREKRHIFRKTDAGALKACLEIHHDHLADSVKDELRSRFGAKWSHIVGKSNRHIDWIAAALIIRFSDTLVCSDCNEVDARIKSRLPEIDKRFSFSPSEISSCITPNANTSHQIDLGVAENIWDITRADFEDRLNLLDLILTKVGAGGLRREEVGLVSPQLRSSVTSTQLFNRFISTDVTDFLDTAVSTIAKRSITKAEKSKGPRKRHAIVPTKEDLAQLLYGNGASKKWDDARSDWACPICERTKFQIVRQSNAKKWFAGIYEHVEWHGIESADEPFIDRHERIDICADCSKIFSELKSSKPALADSFLTTGQIEVSIIEHAPHQKHDVDWAQATQFATDNLRWQKSKAAYWPRFYRAKNLKRLFDEIISKLGTDENGGLDELARLVRNDFQGWEWHDLLEHLHYALEDAKRWPDR